MGFGRGQHPNTLAALDKGRVSWKPGQSGCPGGTRQGGAWIMEHVNSFLSEDGSGKARYTREQIQQAADAPQSSPAKVTAAVIVINGMKEGKRYVVGKDGEIKEAALDPEPGRTRENILDRSLGKPTVTIRHESAVPEPTDLLAEMRGILAADPVLLEEVRQVAELAALPVIDAEAAVIETTTDDLDRVG